MTATESPRKIGFLGLGAMGLPMAGRVARAGFSLVAVDISERQVQRARELGLVASQDRDDLTGCDVIVIMVATPAQLLECTQLACLRPGVLAIVMSTVGPAAVKEFASQVAASGVSVVDAPVSGGVAGAEAGTLSLFVSGAPDSCAAVTHVLDSMGRVFECGDEPGAGQAMKIVNQHLATSNLAIAAEALGLAKAMGLDGKRTLELVASGAGSSWMLVDRGPRMLVAAQERPSLTHLSILAKDANLVHGVAQEHGYEATILAAVRRRWQTAVDRGLGESDDSSLYDTMS
jgi:3-hydroxyisobutyrate dehydrogenase